MKTSLAALLVVAACHKPAVVVVSPPPVADPHAAAVDALVGVWFGKAVATPYGDMPFALAFDRQPDGAVHAHTDDGKGLYLDFTFHHVDAGWVLDENGAAPGVGTQAHTLAATGATHWSDRDVDVDVAVAGDALVMTTSVRGKPHGRFELTRKSGAEGAHIREFLAHRTE
jgi:hypothetical protein